MLGFGAAAQPWLQQNIVWFARWGGCGKSAARRGSNKTKHSMVCLQGPAAANPGAPWLRQTIVLFAPAARPLRSHSAPQLVQTRATAVGCPCPFLFNESHPAPTRRAAAGQKRSPPRSRHPRRHGDCCCPRSAAVQPAARAPAAAPQRACGPGRSDRASPPARRARLGEEPRRDSGTRSASTIACGSRIIGPDEVRPALVRELDVPAVAPPLQAHVHPVTSPCTLYT